MFQLSSNCRETLESLTLHNFPHHKSGHRLQRGTLLKMSRKVYTIQAHKLLHERDHTHTPKGRPKPHAHTDKHTRGENCQPQSRQNLRVPTKPWSPLDTTLQKPVMQKLRLEACWHRDANKTCGHCITHTGT